MKSWVIAWTVLGLLVAVDQGSKIWVRQSVPPHSVAVLIPGLIDLTHVENPGVSFSFLGSVAAEIQALYLTGRKAEAIAKVPAALIDEVALVGPRARIRERLSRWKDSPVTTMNLAVADVATLRTILELM